MSRLDFPTALGQIIRERREENNLTMRFVAYKSNIALGYLSEVERGNKNISPTCMSGLAMALGLEPYELIVQTGLRMAGIVVPDNIAELLETV
jgi:transcriptional regulator with XRE-family HTH domain